MPATRLLVVYVPSRLQALRILRLVGARQALPWRRRRRRAFPFKQGGGGRERTLRISSGFLWVLADSPAPQMAFHCPLRAARVAAFTLLAASGSTALLRALCEPLTGPPGGLLDALALASPRASAEAESPLAAVLFLALSGAPSWPRR